MVISHEINVSNKGLWVKASFYQPRFELIKGNDSFTSFPVDFFLSPNCLPYVPLLIYLLEITFLVNEHAIILTPIYMSWSLWILSFSKKIHICARGPTSELSYHEVTDERHFILSAKGVLHSINQKVLEEWKYFSKNKWTHKTSNYYLI